MNCEIIHVARECEMLWKSAVHWQRQWWKKKLLHVIIFHSRKNILPAENTSSWIPFRCPWFSNLYTPLANNWKLIISVLTCVYGTENIKGSRKARKCATTLINWKSYFSRRQKDITERRHFPDPNPISQKKNYPLTVSNSWFLKHWSFH